MAKKIFDFIELRPNCTTPDIKRFLGTTPSRPPSSEETRIYRIINTLKKEGFISRIRIKNINPGGPQYRFQATKLGKKEFAKVCATPTLVRIDSHIIKQKLIEFSVESKDILQELVQLVFDKIKEFKPPRELSFTQEVQVAMHKLGSEVKTILESM